MGEIKSTLDLVMEKTKNLSLSPEEKQSQRRADFEKRLRGLLQQYADNIESVEGLQDRIQNLQEELKITDAKHVVEAVFKRIDPGRDNTRWLDLLESIAAAAGDPLQEAIAEYNKQKAELTEAAGQRLREQLARRHSIRGTAAKPNPKHDSEFKENLAVLKRETQTRIDAIRY